MRRYGAPIIALCILSLLSTLFFITQPAMAQRLPGSFTPSQCPDGVLVEGLWIECGYLTVAESRRPFNGKTIALAVAIIRSPNPAPDPVVFLTGGPGEAALSLAPLIAQSVAPVIAQRDLILVDQRGTGFSQPSLDCITFPNMTAAGFMLGVTQESERPALLRLVTDALIECGLEYEREGVDLSAYNSVENAADLEDLRIALGYETWNLFGASYGTRLALTAMQYRPETIRSAVLDSTYPLQANFHIDTFLSFNRSLTRLFDACAADPDCNAAYPNLDVSYDAMVTQLNAAPPAIPIINLETGEEIDYIPITGNDVVSLIFEFFYSTQAIPVIPFLIAETAAGNYEPLSLLVSSLLASGGGAGGINIGMQFAVQCNEDATFAEPIDFIAARDANRRTSTLAFNVLFNEAILDICDAWGLTNNYPAENQPVRSDVPSLIITGEFDPVTPTQNAALTAKTLGRNYVIAYPHGGHSPSVSSPCLAQATAAFFNDPYQEPDTSCIAQEAPLPFLVP
ncbi:MAG: alpha/beta hydrolase [Chloroflexales bacterium]|nr:alpha/beta hydrolase [Chloroflexales bacterium]